jgi:hypothetical protein
VIRATVHFETKNTAVMDRLLKELPKLKRAYITVGIHSDAGKYDDDTEIVDVAIWQEFGTSTVPQRSFIRSALNENTDKINQWREEALVEIVEKGLTTRQALEKLGTKIKILIQNKIKSNIPPEYGTGRKPNDSGTIQQLQEQKRRHGFPVRTLIATGAMLDSVDFKVYE